MVIEANGIRLDVSQEGRTLRYTVLEQSKEATKTLKFLGHVRDDETGFTLRSNARPSYKKDTRRFFIRGSEEDKNDKTVKATFPTAQEARNAVAALKRLLEKVVKPDIVDPQHNDQAAPLAGGTTHVRFAFINREMAEKLVLTGKKHYPDEVIDWEPTEPVVTKSRHYNEHIAQVVDVLNKSLEEPVQVEGVINPHKVTPEQAKKTVEFMRSCFQYALEEDIMVPFWRVVTGLRGPDLIK